MKKQLTEAEAESLLATLSSLRETKDQKAISRYEQYCLSQFAYIVKMHTRKYNKFNNYEDVLQEANIALLYALRTYKPNTGNVFAWIHQYVRTRIYRKASKHTVVSYPVKYFSKEENQLPEFFEITRYNESDTRNVDIIDCLLQNELKQAFIDAVASLPMDEQRLVERILRANKILDIGLPRNQCFARLRGLARKIRKIILTRDRSLLDS